MPHDGRGNQSADQTITLDKDHFYWYLMYKDMEEYFHNCLHCKVTKGHYKGPDMQQDSIVDHNPMGRLCLSFTKLDPSKDSKEDVLVLMDRLYKFSQAFWTPN